MKTRQPRLRCDCDLLPPFLRRAPFFNDSKISKFEKKPSTFCWFIHVWIQQLSEKNFKLFLRPTKKSKSNSKSTKIIRNMPENKWTHAQRMFLFGLADKAGRIPDSSLSFSMVFWSIWKGENINQEYINMKKKSIFFFFLPKYISKIVPDDFWKHFWTHQKRKFDDAVFAHHRSRDHHNSNGVFKSVQLALAEVKISSKSWCTQFMNVFKKLFFGTTTGLCLNFDQ